LIRRSPDNIDDPRKYQPNTKTRDRLIPVQGDLGQLLLEYIIKFRPKVLNARRHSFLFTSKKGEPLSLASVTKIFATLRKGLPELPDSFSSHVLRHTWNDRFSELVDNHKVSESEEHKIRSYLMGWSETSSTAAIYTKRSVRKKAREFSLIRQKQLLGSANGEKSCEKN